MAATPAHSSPSDEVHHYREVKGDAIKAVEWRLHKGDGYTLTTTSSAETHVTITGTDYSTRRWHMVTKDGETDLRASRDANAIVIYGHHHTNGGGKV